MASYWSNRQKKERAEQRQAELTQKRKDTIHQRLAFRPEEGSQEIVIKKRETEDRSPTEKHNDVTPILGNARLALLLLSLLSMFGVLLNAQTLSIWSMPQSFASGETVSLQMLDTFSNHIILNANTTIKVNIESLWNINPIETYTGQNINFWFNLSEGCNEYIGLISSINDQSFTIMPDQTALYNPANHLTGVCNTTYNATQIFIDKYEPIAKGNPLVKEGIIGKGFHSDIAWAQLGYNIEQAEAKR